MKLRTVLLALCLSVLVVLAFVWLNDVSHHSQSSAPPPAAQTQTAPAPQADTAAQHAGPASLYPNPELTPGAVFPDVTADQVCEDHYTETVRDVPESVKKQVFAEYGIPWSEHSNYEVDHFISLELGGSNDIKNLWPEPYSPIPGARQKDVVETYLHRQVCAGNMTLKQAQDAITGDWYKIYLEVKSQPHRRSRH